MSDDITILDGAPDTNGPQIPLSDSIAALQARISELENAYHYQQQALQATRDTFTQNLVKDLTKDFSRAVTKRDKDNLRVVEVAKPEHFDGSTDKVEAFLQAVRLVFDANPVKFTDAPSADWNRILFCLSYCTKTRALQWARYIRKRITAEETTWDVFEDLFKDRFADRLPKTTAQSNLRSLHQKLGQWVDDFVNDFETWEDDSGYDDEALLTFFRQGLSNSIKQAIHNLRPMPTTLQGWKDAAMQIDRQNRWYEIDQKFQVSHRNPPTTTHASYSNTRPPGANFTAPRPSVPTNANPTETARRDSTGVIFGGRGQPMDIDAARRRGVCFRCEKPGHLARDCTAPNRRAVNVRALVAELSKEEMEEVMREVEEQLTEAEATPLEEDFPQTRE